MAARLVRGSIFRVRGMSRDRLPGYRRKSGTFARLQLNGLVLAGLFDRRRQRFRRVVLRCNMLNHIFVGGRVSEDLRDHFRR